nr:GNAT family N-acetyltransferase [uncultured Sellimonas sp.]
MYTNNLIIRPAVPGDAKDLISIYAPYVKETAVTFEYDVPDIPEFQRRIKQTLNRYPYLVAEEGETIVGYAYAGPFHTRAAYDWSCEISIYLKKERRRQGLGKTLYKTLESVLAAQNILNVYACIAAPKEEDPYLTENSMRFHSHMGFRLTGRFISCGYKFSRWYDMVWMEKQIGPHQTSQPPVRSFDEVKDFFF